MLRVAYIDVAHEFTKLARRFMEFCSGFLHINSIFCKIGQYKISQEFSTIGVWVYSHAPIATRSKRRQFWNEVPALVKVFFWMVASEPVFQNSEMFWISFDFGYWHL